MSESRAGAAPEPTVSIVIPARNDAVALDHCLHALSRQTRTPLEIVVVDNASEDRTAAVAAGHGARVVDEPHVGIPQAAATGYDAARGDVIARLDADSVPGEDWVDRITVLFSTPQWDAVTGTGYFYGLGHMGRRLLAVVYLGAYYVLCYAALGHHTVWGSNMALRRSVWQEVRPLVHRDSELHDDLDLAFALGPDRPVHVDRSLTVGVSARSLVGWAQMRRRFRRAFRTLAVNWADLPPWSRWARRLGTRQPPANPR